MQRRSMFQKVEKQVLSLLKESIASCLECCSAAPLPQGFLETLTLEIPKEKDFGDFSSNVGMRLSGILKKSPKSISEDIAAHFMIRARRPSSPLVRHAEVKGAGFINIFLDEQVFHEALAAVHSEGRNFGRADLGRGRRLLLEFVSANPTGPLSVAHARQAAVGDALANILRAMGYEVTREYYLNDEGNQIRILGSSIDLRYREVAGETVVFPEDHYQGAYIIDLARRLYEDRDARMSIERMTQEARAEFFRACGVREILGVIREELKDFGVVFDVWYSQRELARSGKIEEVLADLKSRELLYEEGGALWFRSTRFGDDKDRVVRKSDSSYTYLAPDIAYHAEKFRRGFEKLVDIWGPDHHGYIPRMRAAVQALGQEGGALVVIIVQLATLFRNGVPLPMSTRKGQYVTLREILTEVGRDASRFFFLMRKTDSHLDFDLELAKKQTPENPVYYVQYACARIAGILAAAGEKALSLEGADPALLREEEEKGLMKAIFEFGSCLGACVNQLDPYPLTVYLQSLASLFHKFYDRHKVLTSDDPLSMARLYLIKAARIVLSAGLEMLGVSVPERM